MDSQILYIVRDIEFGLTGTANKGPNGTPAGTLRTPRGPYGRRLCFDTCIIRPKDQNQGPWVMFPEAMSDFVRARVFDTSTGKDVVTAVIPFTKNPRDFFEQADKVYRVRNTEVWNGVPAEKINENVNFEVIYGLELSINPAWGKADPQTFYFGQKGEDTRLLDGFTWGEFDTSVIGPGPIATTPTPVVPAPVPAV